MNRLYLNRHLVRDDRDRKIANEIRQILTDRGLSSHMDDTKWDELCEAVNSELPFTPAYQEKHVFDNEPLGKPVEYVPTYQGCWASMPESVKGLHVEWIRVSPRYRQWGRGNAEVLDCTDEFRVILKRLRIPYVEEDGFFTVYGHSSGIEFDI